MKLCKREMARTEDYLEFDDAEAQQNALELTDHSITQDDVDNMLDTDFFINSNDVVPDSNFDTPADDNNNTNNNILYREVKWKDSTVTLYPLNYKTVSLVKYQIIVFLILFSVFGFNDQTTGSLLPTLVDYYNISPVKVSIIFIINSVAYTITSLLNETLHRFYGSRGSILIACILYVIFFSILITKPTNFNIYLVCVLPLGIAVGILDAAGNVLFGNLVVHKNEWMGILHAVYGAAAMVTPPIVSYFVKWGYWSFFFFIPLSFATVALCMALPSFKYETALKYDYTCSMETRNQHSATHIERTGGIDSAETSHHDEVDSTKESIESESFFQILTYPSVALQAILLFFYLGAEITTGSWIFTFLLENKLDDKIKMSYIVSMFWIGLTCGRLMLGFVTKRFFATEYRATRIYVLLTLTFYILLVFIAWIPSHSVIYFILFSVILFFCGFFMGPIFPSASIVSLDILPARLHVSGFSVATSAGGVGSAILPYISGVIFHILGSEWMPLITCVWVGIMSLCWCLYPYFIKTDGNIF